MAREKICGIYCIENLVNSKKYIGQSVDIYKRWDNHKSVLCSGYHCNKYLQRSWNKYKKNNFSFTIIEQCEKEDLNEKEIYWINKLDAFDTGFNLTLGGDGTKGHVCTDETKIKISKSNIGRKLTDTQKQRIKEAIKGKVLKGDKHPFYGRTLSEKEKIKLKNGLFNFYKNNNYTPSWAKQVICVTTEEVFDTITKAAEKYKDFGCTCSNIVSCCKHKRLFSGELEDGIRLQWEYYKNDKIYEKINQTTRSNKPKAIYQYDINMAFIREWESAKVCSQNTGLHPSKISNVCNGKRKQTGGYIFRFKAS